MALTDCAVVCVMQHCDCANVTEVECKVGLDRFVWIYGTIIMIIDKSSKILFIVLIL